MRLFWKVTGAALLALGLAGGAKRCGDEAEGGSYPAADVRSGTGRRVFRQARQGTDERRNRDSGFSRGRTGQVDPVAAREPRLRRAGPLHRHVRLLQGLGPAFRRREYAVRVSRPRTLQEIPGERSVCRHGRVAREARRRVPRQGQLQLAARRRPRAAHAHADHEAGGPQGLQAAHVPGRSSDQGVGRLRRQHPGHPLAGHLHGACDRDSRRSDDRAERVLSRPNKPRRCAFSPTWASTIRSSCRS